MVMRFALCFLLLILAAPVATAQAGFYYPPRGADWETRSPESLGLDEAAIAEAVDFARANEYSGSRDLRRAILE